MASSRVPATLRRQIIEQLPPDFTGTVVVRPDTKDYVHGRTRHDALTKARGHWSDSTLATVRVMHIRAR